MRGSKEANQSAKDPIQQLVLRLLERLCDDQVLLSSRLTLQKAAETAASTEAVTDEGGNTHSNYTTPRSGLRPYCVLLQHSQDTNLLMAAASTSAPSAPRGTNGTSVGTLRPTPTPTASIEDGEDGLYRAAGIPTPAEQALRDWHAGRLFLDHFVGAFAGATTPSLTRTPSTKREGASTTLPSKAVSKVTILLKTLPKTDLTDLDDPSRSSADDEHHMYVIDWTKILLDENTDQQRHTTESVGRFQLDLALSKVMANIQSIIDQEALNLEARPSYLPSTTSPKTSSPVRLTIPLAGFLVIESLTPILIEFGWTQCYQFLHQLPHHIPNLMMILIPVRLEMLSPSQHVMLEDWAQAVLWLQGGQAMIIREGVREDGNTVRQTWNYRLATTQSQVKDKYNTMSIEFVKWQREEDVPSRLPSQQPPSTDSFLASASDGRSERNRRVQLQWEDEGTKKSAGISSSTKVAPPPHIFLQDDDPEFQDYDEEDPDDDLDI